MTSTAEIAWTKLLRTKESEDILAFTRGLDGSIYVGGYTVGNLNGQTNNGSGDILITKYNPDSTTAWTNLLGTGDWDTATCLTTGLDGSIYVSGYTYGNLDGQINKGSAANNGSADFFLIKYSPDGNKAWTKLLGSSADDFVWDLATGSDGSIYVSGSTSGNLDGQINNGSFDAFLIKYNTDGTKSWTKLLGTSGGDAANALTIGLDGSIYVSGSTFGNLDGQINNGYFDAFLIKYNTDGTKAWTKLLGTSGADAATALTTGLDGSIYVTGYTDGNIDGQINAGSTDVFLTKYNPDGTKSWTKLLGTSEADSAQALTIGLDGSIYVGGGNSDAFIAAYNPDGVRMWSKFIGSRFGDWVSALTTGLDGSIYASGGTIGDLFGETNFGAIDCFLIKYSINFSPTLTSSISAVMFENVSNSIPIYAATAIDLNANTTLFFSISGGVDAALFNINSTTGTVTFKASPNFEAPTDAGANNIYDIIVQASDGSLTATQAITITVNNVNEVPSIISDAAATTPENVSTSTAVYAASATDPDANTTLSYSISGGADAALFNINATSGAVTFKTSPNFEAPIDAGANNVYDIIVQASDGLLTASKPVAITVTNVNEAPSITSGATASVPENFSTSMPVYVVTGMDPDLNSLNNPKLVDNTVLLGPYSTVAPDSEILFAHALYSEAAKTYIVDNVIVISRETLLSNPALWTVAIGDSSGIWIETSYSANYRAFYAGKGYIYDVSTDTFKVPGTLASPINYSISGGADAAQFNINASTGAVTFKASPNFEAPADNGANNVYDIIVQASDGSLIASKVVAITVPNVNEAPTITSAGTASTPENVSTSTAVYMATGTDPDANTTLAYSISGGADAALFNINASSGAVTFKVSPNFEAPTDSGTNNVYDIIVQASDGSLTATQAVSISVTNVNDNPPVITSNTAVSVTENTTSATAAYTVTATDNDQNSNLTYSISSGVDATLFNINTTTGAVTFKIAPNFEAPSSASGTNVYSLTVQVSDGLFSATQPILIGVTNLNEAPTITSGTAASIQENASISTVVYTSTATDPDANTTLSYSISGGADVALFNINTSTGAVTFRASPNFEVPTDAGANNVYDIIVQASDGSLTASKAVAISVTNVNEAPSVTSSSTASTPENVSTSTNVYTASATDPDVNTTLSYTIIGGTDFAQFNINTLSGAVTFKTSPNFEAPTDAGGNNVYDIIVQVSDSSLTAAKSIAITVTDINEMAPSWTKLLGTTSDDLGKAVTTGLDGSIYVAGITSGNLDGQINSGIADAFLTKYNVDGSKAWTTLLGSSNYDVANALTTGLDGSIYVSGSTTGNLDGQINSGSYDAFLTKYNVDGSKAWTNLLGSSEWDISNALTTGLDGSIYVSGCTNSNLDGLIKSRENDAFLTKYNVDGSKAWTTLLGSSGTDYANALTTGLDGSIYVSGYTNGNLDGQINSGGGEDVFLTKYNADGSKAWTKLLGSIGGSSNALTTGLDGSIYVSGTTPSNLDGQINSGSSDAFLTKYNVDGSKAWTTLLGSSNYDVANALTTGLDGSIYVSGSTTGNLDGQPSFVGYDAFLMKFSVVSPNTAPTITSSATASITENVSNATPIYTATATDPDANTVLSYSISGGADAALFNINATSGAVTFKTSPNYEAPTDAGANNVYDIIVQASDGLLTATKAVAITVTDVQESSTSSLHGMSYFWKPDATGKHALLSGVTVSATGGTGPTEGANAPIQVKNIAWDASGHVTADIYAHITTGMDAFDLNIDLGSGTNAAFTSALDTSWAILNNPTTSPFLVSGYSLTGLGSGDLKLGSLTFDIGTASQAHIGVNSGSDVSFKDVATKSTAFAYDLAHSTTGSDGSFTFSSVAAGNYAVSASRDTSDIGTSITAADALAALKLAVAINPNATVNGQQLAVSPFQFMAADVNSDGKVTAADALGILKMAVKLPGAITPQWMFVEDTRDFYDDANGVFTLNRTASSWDHSISATVAGNTTENLVGILKGDVNGSWAPPAGSAHVEDLSPTYFTTLANTIHTPLSEFGIFG